MATLNEILAKIDPGTTLVDPNNEEFLAVDIDATEDAADYILDGDEIVRMNADGYRDGVAYRISQE